MRKSVAIIIVNYNVRDMLRECLQSVRDTVKKLRPVVWVVDNASTDGSAEMVRDEFPEVRLIANPDNKGFAAGNNQALKQVNNDYVLLLNPDTVLKPDAIDMLADAHQMLGKGVGVLTSQLLNADGSIQATESKFYSFWGSLTNNRAVKSFAPEKDDKHYLHEIDWAHGAVMFFSKELLDEIKLLDESFFIYGEEIDFYMRVRKAGYTSYLVPQSKVVHYGGASTRQKRADMFIQNYKSLYQFIRKHYSTFEYFAYRVRASVFMLAWFMYFKIKGKDAKSERELYSQLIKWNFSYNK